MKDTFDSSRFYAVPESPELAALLAGADALKQRIDALRPPGGNLWETVQLKLKIDWTYDSNAIEGSTLTRGETNFFLQEGLTVKGKPLKDFLDARNHAEAIDFLREVVRLDRPVTEGLIKEINALLLNGVSHTPAMGQGGAPAKKPAHPGRYKLEPNHVLRRDGSVHRFTEPLQTPGEMQALCAWIGENEAVLHPAVTGALSHYNMERIHPFDDGNGRIARAIGDLLLTRADGSQQRFYSLSAQIQRERKAYYDILERTQKGDMDVTQWLAWFLATLLKAIEHAHSVLDLVFTKAKFWQHAATIPMNERQIKVLNRLLDGFEGKLTTSKWATLAKCSQDTALRDITELLQRGVLQKTNAGGRSTSYQIRPLHEKA